MKPAKYLKLLEPFILAAPFLIGVILLLKSSSPYVERSPASSNSVLSNVFAEQPKNLVSDNQSIQIKFKKRDFRQIKKFINQSTSGRKRIYTFTNDVSVSALLNLNASLGVHTISGPFFEDQSLAEDVDLNLWFRLEFSSTISPTQVIAMYQALPYIEVAASNDFIYTTTIPNDSFFNKQWGHRNTGQVNKTCYSATIAPMTEDPTCNPTTLVGTPEHDAKIPNGWDLVQAFGASNVGVALIDTGVFLNHNDLKNRLITGYDVADNDSDPSDVEGHGTLCAGIIAAQANNSMGVAGVCPDCRVMPIKVADSNGNMLGSYLTDGILYAADKPQVQIISMSLGVDRANFNSLAWTQTDAALRYASLKDKLIFAASGNENDDFVSYPARNEYVEAIGAAAPCTGEKGGRKRSGKNAWWTSYGSNSKTDSNGVTCDGEEHWGSNYAPSGTQADSAASISFIAPTIIPATDKNGGYNMKMNGTSAATPFAAGLAALVMANLDARSEPSGPQAILGIMKEGALDIANVESTAGWDRFTGYGMVTLSSITNGLGGAAGIFELRQNYPNPAHKETTIKFTVPEPQEIRLVMYNMLGQEVKILYKGMVDDTQQTIKMDDVENYASGMYIYTLYLMDDPKKKLSQKMMIIK